MPRRGSVTRSRSPGGGRSGRPPRERAGEVEERILEAARQVFLQRGFEGASVEEIAEAARAGKPTIYARFPGKAALYAAVVAHNVNKTVRFGEDASRGATIEERLANMGLALLDQLLTTDRVALIRLGIAEARRFPHLASDVSRMARTRSAEAVARLLGEVAHTDPRWAIPAFCPDRLATTVGHFLDLSVLPLLLRALFGEDLEGLREEAGPHVSRAVAFFLAACRYREQEA
jgi:AcrR family transcriptional regulator